MILLSDDSANTISVGACAIYAQIRYTYIRLINDGLRSFAVAKQRGEMRETPEKKNYGTKIIARNVINFRTIDMRKFVKLFVNWQVYLNALFADDDKC